MGQGHRYVSLDEVIDVLMAENTSGQDVFPPLEGIPIELPSRKAQLDRWYVYLPWRLFVRVAPLVGKASVVYMILWREGMMHSTSVVNLTTTSLRPCGITRDEKIKALACLETEKLITVVRQRGKNPQVTVLALVGRFGRSAPR